MRKKIIISGFITLSFAGKAQQRDSIFRSKSIDPTEIKALFSSYFQDGTHSAVTGGSGTEKLNVQATTFQLTHAIGEKLSLNWKAGIDVITSASTDNIDYVLSSASRIDRRGHANGTLIRKGENEQMMSIGSGISVESDYLAVPLQFSYATKKDSSGRQLRINVDASFDDLRWGRLNPDYYRAVRLVYPAGLRYKEWSTEYKRQSYNLQAAYSFIINRRMQMNVMPMLNYQRGLLSTPFHRVYFNDGDLRVEKLPKERWKFGMSFLNTWFAGKKSILRSEFGFYSDNFGIQALSFEEELSYKFTNRFYAGPFLRLYTQSASHYFNTISAHLPNAEFYTSDYDLSAFNAIKAGMEFYFLPLQKKQRNYFTKGIGLRLAWYQRSDGLTAVMGTLLFDINQRGRQKNYLTPKYN
ncbi:MAG: DUF3570 domain-containing protein [Bacteroidetes bacterium]|nr:DUF3570 domain-containing protein [Bacteroidota bacterium]